MMALGTQAAPVTDADAVCSAVSSWAAANGSAFASPGTALSARQVYDDDGTNVLYWIVTMANGGAVIASPDTDLDLVVAVLERYEGDFPAGHPLSSILKNDMRNRLAVLARHEASSSGGRPRLRAMVQNEEDESAAGGTSAALEGAITAANAQWAKYGVGGGRPRLRANSLAGGDDSPYVRRIVDGFEEKGRYTFWNQSSFQGGRNQCFNAYTPYNAVCGCVATAGSAILQFFNCTNDPGVVTSTDASFNGTKGTYSTIAGTTDWSVLPANPVYGTDGFAEPDAAGYELLGRVAYNVGVLVDMGWTTSEAGSGAQTSKLADAFKKYGFKTARYVEYSGKPDTDGKEFFKTLYAQLWCGAPAVLSIRGTSGGHAVVACGYARDADADEFCRVFMGWGGSGDSWYKFPKVQDFSQVNGAVTMIGYEDDAVVPVYGETNVPGAEFTLPGYKTNDVTVTVTVNGNGFFGIRVPVGLEDKTLTYERRGKSAMITPFEANVLAEESSGLEELNEAIPDEIVFPLLNTTWKQTMAAGAEVAKRDGKALLVISGTTDFWATKMLTDYFYCLDEISDVSNKFVYVFSNSSSSDPNGPDGNPTMGVFDPDDFMADERWKESNGRLAYETFIDYDASGETNVTVLAYSEDDSEPLTNRVDALLSAGYDRYLRRHSGITVTVQGVNIATADQTEVGAVEPDYGEITDVWTNGEVAVFSAPGTYTNEAAGVIYSCVGWTTNEVATLDDLEDYTEGAEAQIKLVSGDDITLTWVWDVSHYRVTATSVNAPPSAGTLVSPTSAWVAAGTRTTITAQAVAGSRSHFDQWSVKGTVYYTQDSYAALSENGTAVSFTVFEPVEVSAIYAAGTEGAPTSVTNTLVFVSSPASVAAFASPPVAADFDWGENTTVDGAFRILWDETYTDSTGGVWKCANVAFNRNARVIGGDTCMIPGSPFVVTFEWELQTGPEPPPPVDPDPPTPGPISITGIEKVPDGSWEITVSGAVKDCWYWLYGTDDLAEVAGESDSWTATTAVTTEPNPQQATADGDIVFHATATGGNLFWRAKATATETGN